MSVPPLRKYQEYTIEWALHKLYVEDEPGVGLFLDPGLGKTRTTLEIIRRLKSLGEVRRVLVIAPLRCLRLVWRDQVAMWSPELTVSVLHGNPMGGMAMGREIELMNPDSIIKLVEAGVRWDLVVVDESTAFKTWSTRRHKILRKILPHIPKRIILTGTPAANSLADLHAQVYILDDGARLGKSVTYFRSVYMSKVQQKFQSWCKWALREDKQAELLDRIGDICLRLKAEDHLDLPDLLMNDVWVELDAKAKKDYARLKRELWLQLQTGEVFAASAAAAYTKCKQLANGQVYGENRVSHAAHSAKIDALVGLTEELSGKPALILYEFQQDLDRIRSNHNFKDAPAINGQTPAKETDDIVNRWNAGQVRYLLGQWRAMSHGLNLQSGGCQDVVFFGVPDSPEVFDQAYRRVYRQGVSGAQVRVHRLLAKDTVNTIQLERLTGKLDGQTGFLEALKEHAKA